MDEHAMLIWVLFAVMTACAAVLVLWPLLRRGEATPSEPEEAGDVTVYRDQLSEIDRDLEGGLVGPVEAEAARAEIARRILRAARRSDEPQAPTSRLHSRIVAAIAVVAVPLISIGTYLALGHPGLPDAPLAERKAAAVADNRSIEDLVTRVEAHLAAKPDDAHGWEVLAPVYMRLGRMDKAASAWRNAIRIGGPSEQRQNGLGEALTIAASGIVTPEARTAFEASLTVEPRGILPRMYLALSLFQAGRTAESVAAWRAIVALGSEDDAWYETAKAELAKAEAAAGDAAIPPAPAAPQAAAPQATAPQAAGPGPSAGDVEAAARMSPEERSKMIESMVARLEERLTASGGTIEEWERLVRAQKMLGRMPDASAALARARTVFAGDASALARLDALATGLTP